MKQGNYKLNDGRILSYCIYGDIDSGVPVIFSHGLCDSNLLRHYDDDLTKSLGVKIIAIDQPGVGGSSPMPNLRNDRTLINYANDVKELVDNELKLEKFTVAGHSGGGPHSLAIAKLFGPKRVTHGILAAPAPPLDVCDEMYDTFNFPFGKQVIGFCRIVPWFIHMTCHLITWWAKISIDNFIHTLAYSDRTSGNPDTFLSNPKQTQVFKESFERGCVTQGPVGIQGMLQVAFLNTSWGFDPSDIQQHFDIFICDEDAIMKPTMGEMIANKVLPNATTHVWKNSGHYSFVDKQNWIEFWTTLVKRSKEEDYGNKKDN